jgi:uncharacterized membrane protein YhaH (DUF805 family)
MNSNLSPIDWAKRPIEKYADFTGRAPRAEYWWYVLAVVVACIVVSIIESILGINKMVLGIYGPITVLLLLATLVPSISVGVRRLHDTSRSGWWLLAFFIPYVLALVLGGSALTGGAARADGASMASLGLAGLLLALSGIMGIVLLIFYVLPGTPGDNRFGPNPYGAGERAVPAE